MAALPVEILLGLYLGLLTGILPALVAWTLGFVFKYFTGVTLPALGVVVLAIAIAGVNGGLLALIDPTILTLPNAERIVVGIIVVMMMAMYAHSQGDKLGATFPHRLSLRKLRDRTLSTDVIELVGGRGQVRVTVAGEVGDIEGYPPLPADVRSAIQGGEWPYPADLPLTEIERRLEDRLRTTYGLAEVNVTLDAQGQAHVSAAPGTHGVSARVPPGRRAVSVHGLVPTGLARGDEVTVVFDGGEVDGTVVSATSNLDGRSAGQDPVVEPTPGDTEGEPEPRPPPRAATTDGGDGRMTLAVARPDAERLLEVERGHFVVTSRGIRSEFELLSLLRRAGARLDRLTIGEDSELAGVTLRTAGVRDTYGVEVLAVRRDGGWLVAPGGTATLDAGDEVFAVGTARTMDAFREAVA